MGCLGAMSPCPFPCLSPWGMWERSSTWVTLAVVERVSGAGHGSHSLPEEKLEQRLFFKKNPKEISFLSSFLIGGTWWLGHGALGSQQDVLPAPRNLVPRAAAKRFLVGSWGEVSPASAPQLPLGRPPPAPALGLFPVLLWGFLRQLLHPGVECGFAWKISPRCG